jgi:hypothetical protein
VEPAAWEHVEGDVFRFRPARSSYYQLFLDGLPVQRARTTGRPLVRPPLGPLQWALFDAHVYFQVERNRWPSSYALTGSHHRVGITLYEVRNVVIRNLTVQGFQLDGVNAHDKAAGCRFVQLTTRGNGRSGISVGGASRVRVEACLSGNNAAAQLRTEGHSHTAVVDTDLVPNSAPRWVVAGGTLWVDGRKIEREP